MVESFAQIPHSKKILGLSDFVGLWHLNVIVMFVWVLFCIMASSSSSKTCVGLG